MHTLDPAPGHPPMESRWLSGPLAAALAIYFLIFNWGSLRVHFALDDLGNMGHYYNYSPWQLVLSNFLPWRGDSRPMGGLFYIPVYHFAGLNPVPYQAVLLLILLANVYFAYRLTRLLGASLPAAALVALVCCYHGGIANLYYNAAFVFDALCCFFYLACLVYYVRIRQRGQLPGVKQTLVILALFLCALNSKEMAVSIPVMLLVYEWTYRRPAKWSLGELLIWLKGPARVALLAVPLDLVNILGKITGPSAMTQAEGYRPVFTLQRIHDFQVSLVQDLWLSWGLNPGWGALAAIWLLLAFLAWRRRDRPVLRFFFWFLVVVPLPIEFLPGKRAACLVLPMVGGAAFAAVVVADGVASAARYLASAFSLPQRGRGVLAGLLLAALIGPWVWEQRQLRNGIAQGPMTTLGDQSWDLIQQLRASGLHPRRGGSVAFLGDPFLPGTMDLFFLAQLWLHDRDARIHVPAQGPLTAAELSGMDYVLTFENRQLIRLK